ATGDFDAADPCLVDVHVLVDAAGAQHCPELAEVDAGTRAAGLGAALAGLGAFDLVLEIVVEAGDVEAVASVGRVPVQRDLAVDAGFRLQVRVAGPGVGALAAETGD